MDSMIHPAVPSVAGVNPLWLPCLFLFWFLSHPVYPLGPADGGARFGSRGPSIVNLLGFGVRLTV